MFAALIIVVMTGVNIVGSGLVANAQTVIVYIVLGILSLFAVVTLVNIHPVAAGAVRGTRRSRTSSRPWR